MINAEPLKENPLSKKLEEERKWCLCCVNCLVGTGVIAILFIVIGCLLAFTSVNEWFSNRSGVRRVGIVFLAIGILVLITTLVAIFCLIRTFTRYERRINNPEPNIPPKTGYPKQQYK